MPRYNAYNLKYIEAGLSLNAIDPVQVADEGVAVKIETATLEIKNSESQEPIDVIEITKDIEIKAVLLFESEDDLRLALNGEQFSEQFYDFTGV